MPARLIHTRPAPRHRAIAPLSWCWRRVRIAYLRWRLSTVNADVKYESTSAWCNPDQLALYRRCAQALRVQITLLEQQQ
jgi:hypothetical protein